MIAPKNIIFILKVALFCCIIQTKIVILHLQVIICTEMKSLQITIPVEIYSPDDPLLPAEDKALIDEAKSVCRDSYAPYSKFHVGAALRLANGATVRGSNQENAVYPVGCCAERTALYYAGSAYPGVAVEAIAVAVWRELDGKYLAKPGSPCGVCRQHLVETEQRYGQPIKVILYGADEVYVLRSAADLLPLTFTGDELTRQ